MAAGASEVWMMVRLMFAFSLMATAGKINDYRYITQSSHQSGKVRTIFNSNAYDQGTGFCVAFFNGYTVHTGVSGGDLGGNFGYHTVAALNIDSQRGQKFAGSGGGPTRRNNLVGARRRISPRLLQASMCTTKPRPGVI